MIFDLPTSIEFGGREWAVNTDFRDVLRTLTAFEDPNLADDEKAYICLHNTYPDLKDIPGDQLQAAFDAAIGFIDHGTRSEGQSGGFGASPGGVKSSRAIPRTMDWTQDAPLIFPAVNRAAGFEVRTAAYIHWWTFVGYFMEIKDSTYATVLGLRGKRVRGKKLEKGEQEFWRHNKSLCELKQKYTDKELEEQERLKALLGG